jgi:hypothetical protein
MPNAPGLIPFCPVGFNIVVAGRPPIKVLKLPIRFLPGPITMPDSGFIIVPTLSPLLIGVMVIKLWFGIHTVNTLNWLGIDVMGIAIFGYGIGVGIGPAGDGIGVKHTSGIAKSKPAI